MIAKKSAISNGQSKTGFEDALARGLSDAMLVEAAKCGESGAFAELCERYIQQLRRTANRITRCQEDAEDAVQDALLNAFVHLPDFDGRSTFSTWLTRIVINSALMLLRKKRASVLVPMDDGGDRGTPRRSYQIVDHRQNPESHYAQREQKHILNEAIKRLRPTLQAIVQVQQRQDGSAREAAETMGISLNAAKARLFNAQAALRRSSVLKLMHRPRNGEATRTHIRAVQHMIRHYVQPSR
jgi:RNA polymerase sigma factor (sigma-70 family)